MLVKTRHVAPLGFTGNDLFGSSFHWVYKKMFQADRVFLVISNYTPQNIERFDLSAAEFRAYRRNQLCLVPHGCCSPAGPPHIIYGRLLPDFCTTHCTDCPLLTQPVNYVYIVSEMENQDIKRLLENVAAGRVSVAKAVSTLLQELGRGGGRTLIIDENLLGLANELAKLNYNVRAVRHGASDTEIKADIGHCVLVTRNGRHFIADQAEYYYGLIWVTSRLPDRELARKIERLLLSGVGFKKNLIQMFKV